MVEKGEEEGKGKQRDTFIMKRKRLLLKMAVHL
jgi:hypothetical protein